MTPRSGRSPLPLNETSRHALDRGLRKIIEDEEAVGEVVSQFPSHESDEPATKADVALLAARIDGADTRFDGIDARFDRIDAKIGSALKLMISLHVATVGLVGALVGGLVAVS